MSSRFFLACLLFSLLGLLVSCQKSEEAVDGEFHGTAQQVKSMGSDFKVPSPLWDLLLNVTPESEAAAAAAEAPKGGEKKEGEGEGEAKEGAGGAAPTISLSTSAFLYGPLQVILKSKSPGVLKEPEIRIDLPDGGGEVDLSQWTSGKTGSFFVRFGWEGEDGEATEQKVIYYSRTKKRRVGSQTIGSGCKVFMDISPLVLAQKKTGGIVVNTTRNFHTTVLGGHFLFSWFKGGIRKISHVSFRDSKNPQYFCENDK